MAGKMEELGLTGRGCVRTKVLFGQGGAVGMGWELPVVGAEKENQPAEDHDQTSIKYCCRQ